MPTISIRTDFDRRRRFVFPAALLLVAGALSAAPGSVVWAQSETQEKPTLKDFGSSLKRLKWDRKKQAAVESEEPRTRRAAEDEDVVRVNTDLVAADIVVLDKQGRVVSGLSKDDFLITEDGQQQQVAHFSLGSDTNVGRSIVLIIDSSSRMALLPYINYTLDAAKVLINKLGPKDRMAIVDDDVALLVGFTTDKARLEKALESVRIKFEEWNAPQNIDSRYYDTLKGKKITTFGGRQFNALLATARELFDEEDVRPIIIFQTGGEQVRFLQPPDLMEDKAILSRFTENFDYEKYFKANVQQFSLADVITGIEKSRATVYSVVPGFQLLGLSEAEQWKRAKIEAQRFVENIQSNLAGTKSGRGLTWHGTDGGAASLLHARLRGQSALAQVSKSSGGWISFLEEPEQASAIYGKIWSDMNNRYVVGYYPTNKAHDGKRRKVSVEVRNHPEYTVWGRKSYIAAGPEP